MSIELTTAPLENTNVRSRWNAGLAAARPIRTGTVRRVLGNGFEVQGLDAAIGDLLIVETDLGELPAHVVGIRDQWIMASAYGDLSGMRAGQRAIAPGGPPRVPVGPSMLGRVVDALGRPIDDVGGLDLIERVHLDGQAPHPLRRRRVDTVFETGVRAIDTALACGQGQRVGIFAGSGVGKSTLLSMIVRGAQADAVVIGLVGERGREVREFIERDLGPDGMAKSCVVVATGDEPALMRLTAAQTATRIAEDFRDRGLNVLLIVDSITRFAMAQREVGLAAGEMPASRGYPPSVLSALPRLLERSGAGETGTITALYTVLVDGDDMNDPIADTVRGILDGHIVLSRQLAHRGHYPAIDVLASVSRVIDQITDPHQLQLARQLREHLAAYEESRDLIEVGAYVHGSNPRTDMAIALRDNLLDFLQQDGVANRSTDTWRWLERLLAGETVRGAAPADNGGWS